MVTDEASKPCTPLLVLLSSPIPGTQQLGTSTRTKVVREAQDEDPDSSGSIELPSWEKTGAAYDAALGLWLRQGEPLVVMESFAQGTKTMTEVAKEEVDED